MKNRVQKTYDVDESRPRVDRVPMTVPDKEALKAAVLPLLVASPSKNITVQLANVVKIMISADFPEKWPNLLEIVKSLLASNSPQDVIAGSIALLEIIKIYRCNYSFYFPV